MNKYIEAYNDILEKFCYCYSNSHTGNRPCDDGAICDKCMEKDFQELWECIKKGLD